MFCCSNRTLPAVFAALATCLGAQASTSYQYTVLTKPGDVIDGQTIMGTNEPVINDSGQVAFRAFLCANLQCPAIVQTFLGTHPALIATSGSIVGGQTLDSVFGDRVEIDNNGTIYFGCQVGGVNAICTQFSVVVKVGDTIGGVTLQSVGEFFVSKNGLLVFTGRFGRRIIGTGPDGSVSRTGMFTPTSLVLRTCEVQATTTGCFAGGGSGDTIGGFQLSGISFISVNNSGNIVFSCGLNRPGGSICTPSTIVAQNGSIIGGITVTSALSPVINNAGTIAFVGQFSGGEGIFTTSAVLAKTGNTIDGLTIGDIFGVDSFFLSLSDNGTAVFDAFLPSAPGCFGVPSAVVTQSHIVGQSCLTFGNSTVRLTGASNQAINANGWVVFNAEFMPAQSDAVILARPFVTVTIQVQQSPINAKSNGKIAVAILSDANFSAPDAIDRNSLTFGRTGTEQSLAMCNTGGVDLNSDRRPDLLCHFDTASTGLTSSDTQATLQGKTHQGAPIIGSATVSVIH